MSADLSQSKTAQQLNRRRHSVIIISDIECFQINYSYSKKRRFSVPHAEFSMMESSRLRTFDLYTTIFPKLPRVPSNKDLELSETESTDGGGIKNEKILDNDNNKENHNKEKQV